MKIFYQISHFHSLATTYWISGKLNPFPGAALRNFPVFISLCDLITFPGVLIYATGPQVNAFIRKCILSPGDRLYGQPPIIRTFLPSFLFVSVAGVFGSFSLREESSYFYGPRWPVLNLEWKGQKAINFGIAESLIFPQLRWYL